MQMKWTEIRGLKNVSQVHAVQWYTMCMCSSLLPWRAVWMWGQLQGKRDAQYLHIIRKHEVTVRIGKNVCHKVVSHGQTPIPHWGKRSGTWP